MPCKTLLSFGVFLLPSYRFSRCFRLALNCLLLSSLRSVKTLRTFVGVNSYASPSPDSSCEEDSEVTTLLFYIYMSMRSCLLKRIWCISSTFCPLVRSELTLSAFLSFTMILLRYRSRFDGPYFKVLFYLQFLQLRKYLKRCLREYSKKYFSTHYKKCTVQPGTERPQVQAKQYKSERAPCDNCGAVLAKTNMARHKRVCMM